ncbi:hypothetical protein INT48_002725 [Thamnidium elegans]|uniref:Uncharacterized protein n=1 Tax=Thamnidium elegans TaxID=101142 RepID=A0A8H7SXA5_9FUNG|nr:hypothetical protein INT48_002725 [Thamnidium elegans]
MDDNSKQLEDMKQQVINRNLELQASLDTTFHRIEELEAVALCTIPETTFPKSNEIDMGSSQLTDMLKVSPKLFPTTRITALSERCFTPNEANKSN